MLLVMLNEVVLSPDGRFAYDAENLVWNLQIIDVSDPASPQRVGSYNTLWLCLRCFRVLR